MRTKIITSVIGIPILLVLLYYGGWPLFVVTGAVMLLGLQEFYSNLDRKGIVPVKEVGWLGAIGIYAATQWAPEAWKNGLIMAFTSGVVFVSLIAQFWRKQGTSAIANAGATVFGVVYVAVLFSFFLRLRLLSLHALPGIPEGGYRDRLGAIVFVLASVWLMDGAANFVGKWLGTEKPWPQISPNKTWEGAAAGLLAALVGSIVVGQFFRLPLIHMVPLGLLQGVLGQLGDFCESLMKRDLEIKDFGVALPGHGGILDRIDSLLFAMPVVYWYFALFVVPSY